MKNNVIRIVLGTIVGTALALWSHIYLIKWLSPIINEGLSKAHIIHEAQYGHLIVFSAYATLLIPVLTIAILYYFLGDRLPAKTRLGKGIILGIILLLMTGDLIRQPLMNVLVGVPVLTAIIQQIQTWVYKLVITISIAFIVKPRKKSEN